VIFITPHEALEQTAAAMRQHRIAHRLTQEDLSQKSGVPLATLRKFERTGLISLESFFKLALVTGVLDKLVSMIETQGTTATSLDEILKQNKKPKRMRVKAGKKS